MSYTNSQMIAAIEEHVHSAWQREALNLRYIDGLTHEQIAEALGYSTQEMLRDVMEQAPDKQTRRELERIIQKMER